MFFIHLKKNKGSALLTIIVVMAVLILLGFSILTTSVSEARQATFHANKVQANYLARTGVDDVAYAVMDDPDAFSGGMSPTVKDLGDSEYEVEVNAVTLSFEDYDNVTAFEVIGTGRKNNASSKVKLTVLEATLSMVLKSAVYSNSTINISQLEVIGAVSVLDPNTINGYNPNSTKHSQTVPQEPTKYFDDGYYAIVEHYFYFNKNGTHEDDQLNGTLGSPHGRNAGVFDEPLKDFIDDYAPLISVAQTNPISSDGYYGSYLNVSQLVIDTSGHTDINDPLIVVVDEVRLNGQAEINIVGGGYLNLYVRDGITGGGASNSKAELNPGNARVSIFGVGSGTKISFQTPSNSVGDYDKTDIDRYPKIFLDEGAYFSTIANSTLGAYIIGPAASIHLQANSTVIGFVIGDVYSGGGLGQSGGTTETPKGTIDFIPPPTDAFAEIKLPMIKWVYERIQ